MSRLDEIKARAEAATPGPWDVLQYEARTTCDVIGDRIVVTQVRKADAKFIAHARTDNPWLIEQLEAKDAEIERLRAALGIYAKRDNWQDDDWGVPSVFRPDYGKPGKTALAALADQGDEQQPEVDRIPVCVECGERAAGNRVFRSEDGAIWRCADGCDQGGTSSDHDDADAETVPRCDDVLHGHRCDQAVGHPLPHCADSGTTIYRWQPIEDALADRGGES